MYPRAETVSVPAKAFSYAVALELALILEVNKEYLISRYLSIDKGNEEDIPNPKSSVS